MRELSLAELMSVAGGTCRKKKICKPKKVSCKPKTKGCSPKPKCPPVTPDVPDDEGDDDIR